ncbi:hypothetical protein SDC9_212173 [bioreactor metagenome]|uniref:Uncharacterized protein n=1 Tax=bioreactor metagenome TaxID=1076179 RepID=A0A645JLD6_9ZZZZ
MFINPIGRISDSAFSVQQNNNAIMSMTRNAGDFDDLSSVQKAEKQLKFDTLNKKLMYDASSLMQESQKKVQDEDIKRSFSTFA